MAEAIDSAADTLRINIAALGCSLQFGLSQPQMIDDQQPPLPVERVAIIRVTPEFAKGMAFLLREQVFQYEKSIGMKLPVPQDLFGSGLTLTGDTLARWNRCWEE